MSYLHSIILGLIEGLTEFLPVSSTAHLVLAGEWLRIPPTSFFKTFEISIQLGAILAVVILYWKQLWSGWPMIFRLAAAFVPTAAIGFLLYGLVKNYLLESAFVIACALILGGITLIILESFFKKKDQLREEREPSYKESFFIGIFQALAIVPGVSRSAATIIGGLSLGLKRKVIVEFSFLLAIPTMVAATGYDLYKSRESLLSLSQNDITVWLIGFAVAFITAVLGIRFFMRYIQKNDFSAFGWYRIGLGIIVLVWLFLR